MLKGVDEAMMSAIALKRPALTQPYRVCALLRWRASHFACFAPTGFVVFPTLLLLKPMFERSSTFSVAWLRRIMNRRTKRVAAHRLTVAIVHPQPGEVPCWPTAAACVQPDFGLLPLRITFRPFRNPA